MWRVACAVAVGAGKCRAGKEFLFGVCSNKPRCRELDLPLSLMIGVRRQVRIEVWCDWNSAESDLEEIAEAICTRREAVAVVDRPNDIEDEAAMSFFGGHRCDADESQG